MKKSVWLLALAASIMTFCGCQADDTASSASSFASGSPGVTETAPVEAEASENTSYPETTEAVTLSFAVSTNDMPGNFYTDVVSAFNETDANCQIEFADYGTDDTQLRLELTLGTGPDLILTGSFSDRGLLTAKGGLVDLYPYLDTDADIGREDFTNLDLLEESGVLTAAAPNYYIDSYFGSRDAYPEGMSWNLNEFLDTISAADSPQDITGNIASMDFIRMLLRSYTCQYVDYAAASCNFETETFETILQTASVINLTDSDANVYDSAYTSYAELFSQHPDVIYPCTLSGISGFSVLMDELSGVPVTFVGMPTDSGNGALVRFTDTVSVCSYSAHADRCWEFIKFLLTDDCTQGREDLFPVLTRALEEQISGAISKDSSEANTNAQEILQGIATGTLEAAINQEEADLLSELIDRGPMLSEYDSTITPIVAEEAEACISGDKSPAEVASLIQNRVSIYLSEQQ